MDYAGNLCIVGEELCGRKVMEHTLGVPGEWFADLIMGPWPEWVGVVFGLAVLFSLALISLVLLFRSIALLVRRAAKLLKWLPPEIYV